MNLGSVRIILLLVVAIAAASRTLADSPASCPLPNQMLLSSTRVLGYGKVILTYEGNETVRWYATATSTTPLAEGNEYETPVLYVATTYYVATFTTHCESNRVPMVAQVEPLNEPGITQTEVIRASGITQESQIAGLSDFEKYVSLVYYDGLLRPVQNTIRRGSPIHKDLVQPIEYDAFGRSPKSYLPYVANTNTGAYRSDYKTAQLGFYNNTSDKVADDPSPYAQTVFESSPLARPIEQGGVGSAFQPGTTHTTKATYSFNTGATSNQAEEVRMLKTDGSSTQFYGANDLYRTEQIDANGNHVLLYTDANGRTIVKKQKLDEVIDGSAVSYLETYYVYDELDRIKYIISPKGVALLKSGGWTLSSGILQEFTYQFKYDNRGRLAEKKVPGQDWIAYVYDRFNRLVLVQDGYLRPQLKWTFIKYDQQGRAVMQGLYTYNQQYTRDQMQSLVTSYYTPSHGTYPESARFEKRGTTFHGYTNQSFPSGNIEVLAVNYYDSYDFDFNGIADYEYTPQSLAGESTLPQGRTENLPTGSKRLVLGTSNWLTQYVFYDRYGRANQVRSNNHLWLTPDDLTTIVLAFDGRLLISKKYHKAGAGMETTVINKYNYDVGGRLKRVYQSNNGAADQLLVSYQYNELGQMIEKNLHCTNCATLPPPSHPDYVERNAYSPSETSLRANHGIRLLIGYHVTAGNTLSAKLTDESQYLDATRFLQSVDYRYNIQGQLSSINNAQLSTDPATNDDGFDYFGMELLYHTEDVALGNTADYNGNISAVKWKGPYSTSGIADQQSYKFLYDKASRLETATSQVHSGIAWNKQVGVMNESMSYDHNGNIVSLARNKTERGFDMEDGIPTVTSTSAVMDNLAYAYSGTNKLSEVEDASGNPAGFNDGANSGSEFQYDSNGNLIYDGNKGMSIAYNFLGKPTLISFADGRSIQYVYDASGTKLTMKTFESGNPTAILTTDYAGSFVYENGALSFFGSAEGRVVKKGGNLNYEYALADHQGNTRVVFTSAAPTPAVTTTSFETTSDGGFMNYTNGVRSSMPIFSTVPGTYSQMLNGGNNSQIGVAKAYKVGRGDQLKIEAYAKFYNPTSTTSNLTGFASALLGAFGNLPAPAPGETGTPSSALNSYGVQVAGGDGVGNDTYPKAFVTILLFDNDYNFVDIAYEQIDGGEEDAIGTPVAHDHMMRMYTVKEPGYAFMFISNENPTEVQVYFDDVTMTHTPTNIIQYNEYYPFGLSTSTSWTRENHSNNFLYNAANELNTNTGWYEMFYRGYDPALGRMLQVDPLATKFASHSPYNYALNSPALMNDPRGAQAQAPPGTSQMGWNRMNRIAGMSEAGDYYAGWDEDFSFYDATGGSAIEASLAFAPEGGSSSLTTDQKVALIYAYLTGDLWIGEENYSVPNYELLYQQGNNYYLRQNGSEWFAVSDANSVLAASGINIQPGDPLWEGISSWSDGVGMAVDGAAYRLGKALEKRLAYEPRQTGWGSWTKPKTPVGPTTFRTPIGTVSVNTNLVRGLSKGLQVGGAVLGAAGIVMTGAEIYSGKKDLIGEGGLDLIMGGVAFIPGGGWIASGVYFGGKWALEATGNDFWNK